MSIRTTAASLLSEVEGETEGDIGLGNTAALTGVGSLSGKTVPYGVSVRVARHALP